MQTAIRQQGSVVVACAERMGNSLHVRPFQPEQVKENAFVRTYLHSKSAQRMHVYERKGI